MTDQTVTAPRPGERLARVLWPIGLAAISLVLALLAIRWMGYDFSLLSSVGIGDRRDGLTFPYFLFQAIDNLLNRPLNLGYALIFSNPLDPTTAVYTIVPYGIAVITLPVYLLSGGNHLVTANLYVIATFPLTVLAGYWLARYLLTAPRPVAALVGIMLAFAPVRILHLHLSHPEILSLHALLIAIYVLHRLIDAPRPVWSIALAVGFWYLMLTSAYLGYFFLIYALIVAVWLLLTRPGIVSSRLIGWSIVSALVALLIIAPFFAYRLTTASNLNGHPFGEIEFLAARPLNWVQGTSYIYFDVNGREVEEKMVFLGFIPLMLAVIGAVAARRQQPYVTLWIWLIALAYLFTLGPLIALGEDDLISPYLILLQLPGAAAIRHTPRYILLAVVGVMLLAGAALTHWYRRFERPRALSILLVIAVGFAIESIPYDGLLGDRAERTYRLTSDSPSGIPLISTPRFASTALNAWMAAQPPATNMFNFPVNDAANQQYIAALPFHRQPMLNGQASFYPVWYRDRDWNRFPSVYTLWALRAAEVRYALIYEPLLTGAELSAVNERIADFAADLTYVTTIDAVQIYRVEAPAPRSTVRFEFDEFVPGSSWYGPERRGEEETFAWTNGDTFTLDLPPLTPDQPALLRARIALVFQASALEELRLTVGGQAIPLVVESSDAGTFVSGRLPADLQQGAPLHLRFTTVQTGSPLLNGSGADSRALGLGFDWLEVTSEL